MKKLPLILFFIIVVSQLVSAQVNSDTARSSRISDRELGLQYLKKANKQRTTAWIMLGAGLTMEIVSMKMVYDSFESEGGAEVIFLIGGFLTIASVPVFIGGAKNRGRAEILLRHENIRVYNNSGSGKEGMLSLGLSIPLRGSRK